MNGYDNIAGVTFVTGFSDAVITGRVAQYDPIIGNLQDGQERSYKIQFTDPAFSEQYETGIGTWVEATNTFLRTTVKTSSNNGDKENFSPGKKVLFITHDNEAVVSMDNKVEGENTKIMTASERASVYQTRRYTDRFGYKAAPLSPIFILNTGQSNAQGISVATTQFITPDDPAFSHVWDFANPSGSPQSTDPSTFTWVNPNPQLTGVTNVGFGPYIGYWRGGRGHAALAMAYELYRRTGRDVYVLTIAMGGAAIKYWQSGTPIIKDLLENFVPYVKANTPALAGITAPDIIIWGQSEANAIATADTFSADYLLPLDYKNEWLSVFESGKNIWYDPAISRVVLMEPTQYVNWTGTPSGEPGDVTYDYPFRWEGINAVERYTDESVRLVSSIGIPWETDGGAAFIHYSGDGLNQYGRRLADAIMGDDVASGAPSSELRRELAPGLGGDLDADHHKINNASEINAESVSASEINAESVSADTVNVIEIITADGVCISTVPDGSSAVGHTFDTPEYTTPGAKAVSVRVGGVEIASIDFEGVLTCNGFASRIFGGISYFPFGFTTEGQIATTLGTFLTSRPNTGTNAAWNYNTVNEMSGDTTYARWRNAGTAIFTMSHTGLPGFFGIQAPKERTTSGDRVGVTSAGSTDAIFRDTKFGESGTGYTIGDIVECLKAIGLLAP